MDINEGRVDSDSLTELRIRVRSWRTFALATLMSLFSFFACLADSEAFQVTGTNPEPNNPRVDSSFTEVPIFGASAKVTSSESDRRNPLLKDLGNRNLAKPKQESPWQMKARYHLEQGTSQGYLILSVDLVPGAYIHSLTLTEELGPSKITVAKSEDYRIGEKFHPDREPTIIEHDPIFERRMEKHLGQVQFFVPLEIRPGLDLQKCQPQVIFDGQVCTKDGICIALKKQVVQAEFAGYFEKSAEQSQRNQK
jgi:hypothetical protein